jgi:hypothetical protein
VLYSSFTPRKSWLYNNYTGASNQIGWILVDGDISVNVGTFMMRINMVELHILKLNGGILVEHLMMVIIIMVVI